MGNGEVRKIIAATLFLLLISVEAGASAQEIPQSRGQIAYSFAPVAKAAMPAVVNIYSRKVVQRTQSGNAPFDDPFFRHFFGEDSFRTLPRERVERSLGSGVIVDASGLVVTNHHVVDGGEQITVVLSDRREFEATLVGSDERTDLALLRIDPKGEALPALSMGDSDAVEVGDLVLAIGNPFGVGQTVTSGIISALARSNVGVGDYRSFIQTDAAINPGNSGGALVAMDGRLIGINTAIYSRSGGSIGIGFAIPTSLVRVVIASLTKDGKVVRPWLGVTGEGVTYEMAQALKLARPSGVLISNIVADSPADRAGVKEGDLIVSVDGHVVEDAEAMRFRLALLPIGSKGSLVLIRNGVEKTVIVDLLPPPEVPPREETQIVGNNPFSGAVVANLNPALAEEIEVSIMERGVIVLRVERGSAAARLGVRPGDLIRIVNGQKIVVVSDLKKIDDTANRWTISVERDGKMISATVLR